MIQLMILKVNEKSLQILNFKEVNSISTTLLTNDIAHNMTDTCASATKSKGTATCQLHAGSIKDADLQLISNGSVDQKTWYRPGGYRWTNHWPHTLSLTDLLYT